MLLEVLGLLVHLVILELLVILEHLVCFVILFRESWYVASLYLQEKQRTTHQRRKRSAQKELKKSTTCASSCNYHSVLSKNHAAQSQSQCVQIFDYP